MAQLIRPMVAGDLAAVAAIEARVFSDPWSATAFREMLRQPHVVSLAAEASAGSGVAGYAMGSVVAGEGEILNLAVDAPAQRGGIGRALLEALLAELRGRGAEAVYLEVRRSNAAAIALYHAYGFREVATRRGYYRAPREDAVVMVLDAAAV